MYLNMINTLTNIFISCSGANLAGPAFGEKKEKKIKEKKEKVLLHCTLFKVLPLNTKWHRLKKQNMQVWKVTLRESYGTYVFVDSVVTLSPDFPGPCIDSMAVE